LKTMFPRKLSTTCTRHSGPKQFSTQHGSSLTYTHSPPTNILHPRLALRYADTKPDALTVSATGTGGLSEFVSSLASDEAVFGYVRLTIGNDEYSQRSKFCFIRWCGPDVKVMRKARLGIQSGEVREVIRTYAVEIQTDEKKELEEERVMMLVRRAMGANCKLSEMSVRR
jgi:hypothetical protein